VGDGYEIADFDEDLTASPGLARSTRISLILAGLLLLGLIWPVGFAALVISGGGHGSPFDGGPAEFVMGLALLAVPVIMLVLGLACLACTTRRRLRVLPFLALAVPLDLVVALVAGAYAMRSPSPRSYAVPPANTAGQAPMVAEGGGTTVSIACNPTTGACITTTQPAAPPSSPPTAPEPAEPDRRLVRQPATTSR
jgi:hypothetical protein